MSLSRVHLLLLAVGFEDIVSHVCARAACTIERAASGFADLDTKATRSIRGTVALHEDLGTRSLKCLFNDSQNGAVVYTMHVIEAAGRATREPGLAERRTRHRPSTRLDTKWDSPAPHPATPLSPDLWTSTQALVSFLSSPVAIPTAAATSRAWTPTSLPSQTSMAMNRVLALTQTSSGYSSSRGWCVGSM